MIIVRACLSVLLGLKGLFNDFLFACYAAEYWVTHAQFEDVSSHIKYAIKRLFDADRPHFAIWIGLVYRRDLFPEVDIPLDYVAYFGFRDAAEHIIAEHPEQINARNRLDLTPLHAAATAGRTDILSLLLKHGADLEARGLRGETPLLQASIKGNLEAGRCLLDHGADINPRAWRDLTPLCIAVFRGHVEFARMLLERANVGQRQISSSDWTQAILR